MVFTRAGSPSLNHALRAGGARPVRAASIDPHQIKPLNAAAQGASDAYRRTTGGDGPGDSSDEIHSAQLDVISLSVVHYHLIRRPPPVGSIGSDCRTARRGPATRPSRADGPTGEWWRICSHLSFTCETSKQRTTQNTSCFVSRCFGVFLAGRQGRAAVFSPLADSVAVCQSDGLSS
jgi:hypothetical protein